MLASALKRTVRQFMLDVLMRFSTVGNFLEQSNSSISSNLHFDCYEDRQLLFIANVIGITSDRFSAKPLRQQPLDKDICANLRKRSRMEMMFCY